MPRRAVILVAGGTGTRMKSKIAKQFMVVADKPVLVHTFEAFQAYDSTCQFILVLHESLSHQWEELQIQYNFKLPHTVVFGGEERFHSVLNGLNALEDDIELVAIHDAVRPLVSKETIARCFTAAIDSGASIPVIPVADTIRQITNDSSITLPRKDLVAVQTPQCFNVHLLKAAYQAGFNAHFTDDASVVEHSGHDITLVEGEKTNIKITTKEDLLIAASFFAKA